MSTPHSAARIVSDRPVLEVVTASANANKVREIASILSLHVPELQLLPRPDAVGDIEEDAPDLAGNALLKAMAVARATAKPAISDDTGLFVDALNGAPGVRSARYAGDAASDADNRAKLLAALNGVSDRRARFVTVALLAWPKGGTLWCQGEIEGTIAAEPRGEAGFGYDSVFVPHTERGGSARTFAEMAKDEKDAISHRFRAFHRLGEALRARPDLR